MPTKAIEMKQCPFCQKTDDVICLEPGFELAFMQETLDRSVKPIIGEKIKAVTLRGNKFLCCPCGVAYYEITGREDSEATVQDKRFMKEGIQQVIGPGGLQHAGVAK